jgi:hypothetical protein
METRDLITDSILRSIRTEVDAFVGDQDKIKCPVEYELKVIEIARKFARTLISESQGQLGASRNQKKR